MNKGQYIDWCVKNGGMSRTDAEASYNTLVANDEGRKFIGGLTVETLTALRPLLVAITPDNIGSFQHVLTGQGKTAGAGAI